MNLERTVIYGSPCSGKSTLAADLSQLLDIPAYHLDDIFWNPGWKETPIEEFKVQVEEIVPNNCWIIDGNYTDIRPITLPKATAAIILNPPLIQIFWRLFFRSLARDKGIKRGKISRLPEKIEKSGGKERFFEAFFILGYFAVKFKLRRFKRIVSECRNQLGEENFLVFRRQKKLDKFLETIKLNEH